MQQDDTSRRVSMSFYSQNSTRRLGWALRASSKLLFFSTRTSSSSVISARLATASVQRSRNFIIVAEGVDGGITGNLEWVCWSFPLVKVWESSWYFVSTATNVAQARRKQKGQRKCACAFIRRKAVRVEMWLDRSSLHLEVNGCSSGHTPALTGW